MKPDFRETAMALLRYEPETGHFFYRNPSKYARPDGRAGTELQGYIMVRVGGRGGRVFRAHRLAWLFMTGDFPPKGYEIDHANGDRADNRWSNLRLATRSQNNMNLGLRRDNKSGKTGVSYHNGRERWTVRLAVGGRVIGLGDYRSLDAAIAARKAGEIKYFGQFAPQNLRLAVERGGSRPAERNVA